MVAGSYQTKPALPFSPGLEAAGIVAACGDGVTRFKPGDRVMAILAHGGLAELAVAPEAETFAIPDRMSFDEAGAFPVAYISSHVALRWQARLEPGETLLVLGAAGGVGLTAVEIGKAMGARVIAAASTAEKLAVAGERGADELVNYATEKLTDRVMALTDGKGADVCFDPVGGELFDAALSSLGWGGRILLIGFVAGVPKIPANRLLVKHRSDPRCATSGGTRRTSSAAPSRSSCGGTARASSGRWSRTACRSNAAWRRSGCSRSARPTARSSW
jgi:NADPH:quinone reductase